MKRQNGTTATRVDVQSAARDHKVTPESKTRHERNTERAFSGGAKVDPEVSSKAKRRHFTAKYKLRILQEADACERGSGELGALLRREGLYSSHLSNWRRQRELGELEGLTPKKRGRKAKPQDPMAARVRELKRENERLQKRLSQAETIIDVQKKVSRLLGIEPDTTESDEKS